MYICCVPSCRSTSKITQMHRFPRDDTLCRMWVDQIGNQKLANLPLHALRMSYRVCNFHFKDDAIIKDGHRRRGSCIKADAVPYLYLPSKKSSFLPDAEDQEVIQNRPILHTYITNFTDHRTPTENLFCEPGTETLNLEPSGMMIKLEENLEIDDKETVQNKIIDSEFKNENVHLDKSSKENCETIVTDAKEKTDTLKSSTYPTDEERLKRIIRLLEEKLTAVVLENDNLRKENDSLRRENEELKAMHIRLA